MEKRSHNMKESFRQSSQKETVVSFCLQNLSKTTWSPTVLQISKSKGKEWIPVRNLTRYFLCTLTAEKKKSKFPSSYFLLYVGLIALSLSHQIGKQIVLGWWSASSRSWSSEQLKKIHRKQEYGKKITPGWRVCTLLWACQPSQARKGCVNVNK